MPTVFDSRQQNDDECQDDSAGSRGERKAASILAFEHRDDGACFARKQGDFFPICDVNSPVEVLFQVERQELLFLDGGRQVGLESQQQVVAHCHPRVAFRVLMGELAEGRTVGFPFEVDVNPFPVRLQQHVASTGGAVVVEEVVAVFAVLRAVVLFDGIGYFLLVLWREVVQLLLDDSPLFVGIGGTEIVERLDAHLVVGESEDEAQHEVRFPEIEHAVVDGNVNIFVTVDVVDGRMSIEAPRLLSRLAGEQAERDG